MATRILALFNLKDGISVADYEAWAKRVDLPTVNGLGSIQEFRVFKSTGLLGSDDAPPYQYFEIIDVIDMDQFGQEVASDVMQKVAGEFQSMASDIAFILSDEVR